MFIYICMIKMKIWRKNDIEIKNNYQSQYDY